MWGKDSTLLYTVWNGKKFKEATTPSDSECLSSVQVIKNAHNERRTARSVSLVNSLLWLTLSKALEASSIVTYIDEPFAM